MSWRVVAISTRCKLDLKMGYMVVRGKEVKRVYLDEIAVLLIENPAVSLTGCLIEALVEKKIKVIFCDSRRSPTAELIPFYGSYDDPRKIKAQIDWRDEIKDGVWCEIVREKIRQQATFLTQLEKSREASLLESYLKDIESYDATNREGHAAKVYFNGVFGMAFTRSEPTFQNMALNYGYGILLSVFNREVVAHGYLTQLGLFHDNMFNHFNLSCDLMEPWRVLVDRRIFGMEFHKFDTEEKHQILGFLNGYVRIDDCRQTILNAIRIYVRSVFEALNERDVSKIKFFEIEV